MTDYQYKIDYFKKIFLNSTNYIELIIFLHQNKQQPIKNETYENVPK